MPDVDEPPCDFIAYLQQSLGVAHEQAVSTLARWLESYEPVATSKLRQRLGEQPSSQLDRRMRSPAEAQDLRFCATLRVELA